MQTLVTMQIAGTEPSDRWNKSWTLWANGQAPEEIEETATNQLKRRKRCHMVLTVA
ncbi:MAG TPA: hypothetical protein VM639_23080 [Dongiaceae bacterium]|nr:hypothetical protein [Dongiaceae bacterium]